MVENLTIVEFEPIITDALSLNITVGNSKELNNLGLSYWADFDKMLKKYGLNQNYKVHLTIDVTGYKGELYSDLSIVTYSNGNLYNMFCNVYIKQVAMLFIDFIDGNRVRIRRVS